MKNERKEKIKELKKLIKESQAELIEFIKNDKIDETLSADDQKLKKKEYQDGVQVRKVKLQELKETLNLTRMNKYNSSFFEWLPTPPGRAFRKMARQSRLA